MRNFVRLIILPTIMLSGGCGNAGVPNEESSSNARSTIEHPGYGGIRIGASLEDTLGVTGATYFRPEDVALCLMNMPSEGCILVWNNWAVPYLRKNGVPYRLNLTFDRWDKLTDITLVFSRRENDLSAEHCMEIHERTLSWLVKEFGTLNELASPPLDASDFLKTLRSAPLPTDVGKPMDVFLISNFLAGSCDVNVSFSSNSKAGDRK